MRPYNNVFVELLKPIDRRAFKEIAKRHAGDAYDKSFRSWDHLVALVFAQLSGASSLRELEAAFNALPVRIIIWGRGGWRARRWPRPMRAGPRRSSPISSRG